MNERKRSYVKQKIGLLVILILLLNLLSGCWNRRELNELAIMVGMGIDKSEDQYIVTTQVVNPSSVSSKEAGGRGSPVITFIEKGDTVFKTIRKITTTSPRKIYGAHLRVLVIGEELAKEGLSEILDFFLRDHEMGTDFYVIIAKDTKAEDILKVLTPLEVLPANKLFSSLETSEKVWAPTVSVTLDELITEITSDGINPNLTGIMITGNGQKGEVKENIEQIHTDVKLQYSGIAVFKKDKLIGWLNEDESKGLNYILGNVESTLGELPCPGEKGEIGIELIRTKAKMKMKVENGRPKGSVEIEAVGNVGDVGCKKLDLTKPKTIDDLEKKVEVEIKKLADTTITKAKEELEIDMFGFGEELHRSDPDYWKKVKKDWNLKFMETPIEVNVNMELKGMGTISNSPFKK
jgi:spore germination protein KC